MKQNIVEMHSKLVLHQRVYRRKFAFDLREFPAGSMEWVWPTLIRQSLESINQPRYDQDLVYLQKGLRIASVLPSWVAIAESNLKTVTVEKLLTHFHELESHLLETFGKCFLSARISALVRSFLVEVMQFESHDSRMFIIRKLFRTRCLAKSNGRALISDIPHANRPPLQAIGHATAAELRNTTKEILEWDLSLVRTAAMQVLKNFETAVSTIETWEQKKFEFDDEERVRSMVKMVGHENGKDAIWDIEDIKIYLTLELLINQGKKPPFERYSSPLRTFAINVREFVLKEMGEFVRGKEVASWLQIREAPPGEVLLACALIIQIKTAWNFISVLELTPESIKVKDFPHQIQSIKPRTKDKTPIVFVERGDEDVLFAFRILAERYERIIALGIKEPSLWASRRSIKNQSGEPLVGWSSELRLFCKKYGLPNFSNEMVRGQVLAAETLATGNIERAQSKAGHVRVGTTYEYVNKLLIQRMNSANLYEFENRFDATVRYLIKPNSVPNDQVLLSYPIGDGASCKDPEKPPTGRSSNKSYCEGNKCHTDEGCPQRVIEITEERIEELIRTRTYYEKNWDRLLNENEIAFERLHLHRLEFTFGLYGMLRRGPYRHLLKKYEN